jgi:hypothetical protein
MPENIPVRFRDCSCPGTPHPDGDVAELVPYLNYKAGHEALRSITITVPDPKTGEDVSVFRPMEDWPVYLVPVYLTYAVEAWNVVDAEGEPVPLHPALEELRWEDAYELGDKADDLYGAQVLAPLVKRASVSTKAGRTNGSTPPRRPSSRKPRTRSQRSS